jgi:hypothetical protein
MAMSDTDGGEFDVVPVTVVMRSFPARPSAVPDIRDFVRRQLTRTPLPESDIRTIGQQVGNLLLEVAGTGGTIQVVLRIFGDQAEVDVLEAGPVAVTGTTRTVVAKPADTAGPVPVAPPAGSGPAGPPVVQPAPEPVRPLRQRHAAPFSEWLADALRREGLTMEATARRVQVLVKTVSRWVGGTTEPRLRDLSRIRDVFGDLPFP